MDDLIGRQAAIDFIKDHSYPVRYNRTSIEQGMTLKCEKDKYPF